VSETQATETPCAKPQEVPPHNAVSVNAFIPGFGFHAAIIVTLPCYT
jgi:hypothetical protein